MIKADMINELKDKVIDGVGSHLGIKLDFDFVAGLHSNGYYRIRHNYHPFFKTKSIVKFDNFHYTIRDYI